MSGRGRFVWYELLTNDPDASVRFYGKLFGWTFRDAADREEDATRRIVGPDGRELGGVVPLHPEQQLPCHWIAHLTVEGLDGLVERIPDLGGVVGTPPIALPGVGRFAVVTDPGGAAFAALEAGSTPKPAADSAKDGIVWCGLHTTDPRSAARFYGDICGWSVRGTDSDRDFLDGTRVAAGLSTIPAAAPAPPFWLVHVAVDDLDVAARKIEAAGGRLAGPAPSSPTPGKEVLLAVDATGATLGLLGTRRGRGRA